MVGRRAKIAASFGQFTPGPGAYALDRQRNSAPAFRLGTAKRGSGNTERIPGPGSYNPILKLSKGTSPGWRYSIC